MNEILRPPYIEVLSLPNWWTGYNKETLEQDPCSYCGKARVKQRDKTLDHIVPVSAMKRGENLPPWQPGDSNNYLNKAPACFKCNQHKQQAPLLLYLWAVKNAQQAIAAGANRRKAIWYQLHNVSGFRKYFRLPKICPRCRAAVLKKGHCHACAKTIHDNEFLDNGSEA